MIAPLEASEPYRAAAAAPFNTVIDSMSSGFKSLPLDAKSKFAVPTTSTSAKPP